MNERPTFKDSVVTMLRRWKATAVICAVCVLVIGGYGTANAVARYKDETRTYNDGALSRAEAAAAAETLRESEKILSDAVFNGTRQLQSAEGYASEDPMLRIDPSAADTETLTFRVRGERPADAVRIYASYLDSGSFTEAAAAALPYELDARYLGGLIFTKTGDGWFSVKVVQTDPELCGGLAAAVKKAVGDYAGNVSRMSSHRLDTDDSGVFTENNEELRQRQQRRLDLGLSMHRQVDAYSEELLKVRARLLELSGDDGKPGLLRPIAVSLLHILLGAAAGIAATAAAIYFLRISDGAVYSERELNERTGLSILGASPCEKKKRAAFEVWADRLAGAVRSDLGEEENAGRIIANLLARKEKGAVLLTGDVSAQRLKALCASLTEAAGDCGLNFVYGSRVGIDGRSTLKLLRADSAVIVAQYGKSSYAEIASVCATVSESGKRIAGAVLI